MPPVDDVNLLRQVRLRSALGEARILWVGRFVSIAGATALMTFVASPLYILSFGAVRLALYGLAHTAAGRGLVGDPDRARRAERQVALLRTLMGLHLCGVALDLSIDRSLIFVGSLLLLGYLVVAAHQAQPTARARVVALAPPLLSLAAIPLFSRTVAPADMAAVGLFLVALLLTAVRRNLVDRRLIGAEAAAIGSQAELAQGIQQALIAEEVAHLGSWRLRALDGALTWSPGMFRVFGMPWAAKPPGLGEVYGFYEPGERERVEGLVESSLRERTGFETEQTIRRADGEVRFLRVRACFAQEDDGPGSLYGVVQDVTAEHRALAALTESEAKYRLVTEHATDVIAAYRPDGAFTYLSPAIRSLLGREPDDFVGRRTYELIHPDDQARVTAEFTALVRSGDSSTRIEYRAQHANGSWLWVEAHPTPLLGADGTLTGFQDVVRDISARRSAQDAAAAARSVAETALQNAHASEARYRLLAENANDMISTSALDSTLRYVTPAVSRVLGYAPEELVGRKTLDLTHPDDVVAVRELFEALARAGPTSEATPYRFRARHKDGRWVWLEGQPRVQFDERGRPQLFQDVVRNITARKHMEDELAAARVKAEAAAQAKSDFLANMSHELRTPLTSILGYTALMSNEAGLPSPSREYVRRVQNASKALLCTVNDILDYSKLEAGQVTLRPRPTDILAVCRSAIELFEPQAADRAIELRLEVQPTAPPLLADPERLLQILLNLVGNAVKFTDRGSVTLAVDFLDGKLSLRVRDTGPGIASAALDALFDRFTQADDSSTRSHGGTGLGLSICRGLAERMGGTISMHSQVGEGSTFTLVAPVQPAGAAACETKAPPAGSDALEALRILVVDDVSVNRELARLVLTGAGAEVVEAEGGEAALALLARQPFDAVLLDVHMPDLSGRDVLATLRARAGPNDSIPAVAFTAGGGDHDDDELAAFDSRISKPFRPSTMVAVIASLVGGGVEQEHAVAG